VNELIEQLPHRPPFRFVSSVVNDDPESFEASWSVDGSEEFFRGHFPSDPIVPGVLVTEALAQTAGMLLIARSEGSHSHGMLVHSEIRFRIPIRPPALIALYAHELGSVGALYRLSVTAKVAGVIAAEGTLVLAAGSASTAQ
jgi:3-hydroxyacyl-[acyl-carrier-protein] dehydratase